MIDPAKFIDMTKEELAGEYMKLTYQEEEIVASKIVFRAEILERMKLDAEVWGGYGITKVKRANYKDVTLEVAKSLGAVKETVDTTVLGKLHKKGVKIEGVKESIYPMIRDLTPETV